MTFRSYWSKKWRSWR